MKTRAYVLDAVWAPYPRRVGDGLLPSELLAHTVDALVELNQIDPTEVDDVIVALSSRGLELGGHFARKSMLKSCLPSDVPVLALDRNAASGLQAVGSAAIAVQSNLQDLVIAAGVGIEDERQDYSLTSEQSGARKVPCGILADLTATIAGISRAELDNYALSSHVKADRAMREGRLRSVLIHPNMGAKDSVFPLRLELSSFSGLKPCFAAMGESPVGDYGETYDEMAIAGHQGVSTITHLHTLATVSEPSRGAAAVLVASERFVDSHRIRPRASFKSIAAVRANPVSGDSGVSAVREALARAEVEIQDIDLFEIGEPYAVFPLRLIRALSLPAEKVNVNGGSLAFGESRDASGPVLVGIALGELERRKLNTALILLNANDGQAVAMVIERV